MRIDTEGQAIREEFKAGRNRKKLTVGAFSRLYDDIEQGINAVGLSSHKLALWQIARKFGVESIEFGLAFPRDYTLARWR